MDEKRAAKAAEALVRVREELVNANLELEAVRTETQSLREGAVAFVKRERSTVAQEIQKARQRLHVRLKSYDEQIAQNLDALQRQLDEAAKAQEDLDAEWGILLAEREELDDEAARLDVVAKAQEQTEDRYDAWHKDLQNLEEQLSQRSAQYAVQEQELDTRKSEIEEEQAQVAKVQKEQEFDKIVLRQTEGNVKKEFQKLQLAQKEHEAQVAKDKADYDALGEAIREKQRTLRGLDGTLTQLKERENALALGEHRLHTEREKIRNQWEQLEYQRAKEAGRRKAAAAGE